MIRLRCDILGGRSRRPPMESAFDIAGSDTQDIVYFRSGDVPPGQILTETINIVTP